jgi:CubicO group peptidase (beta-lactamase class C family)
MTKDLQDTIQTLLTNLVAEGKEGGVQAAVYLDGKLIVDAWAGVADVRTGRPVDGDTMFPAFSTTKGIFSTVLHILAERGKLDYDAPIAKYWPEFAANGKEAIKVRHALNHSAGLPYMPEGVTREQVCDWDFMCAALAQMKPAWAAGSGQMYHPITFGWLVGEIARRVDGRAVPQIWEEEICRPLGITRMFCGIPAALEPETAFLELVPDPPVTPTPPPHDVAPSIVPLHAWMNSPEGRRAPQPGYGGIMNARSVARHYAALLPGGVDGVELLPPSRVRLAIEEQIYSNDAAGSHSTRGLGYQLGSGSGNMGLSTTAFGHDGYGGSTGYVDLHRRIAVGVTLNLFSDYCLTPFVTQEVHRALDVAS